MMRRREFITLLGGAADSGASTAPAIPVVGVLVASWKPEYFLHFAAD